MVSYAAAATARFSVLRGQSVLDAAAACLLNCFQRPQWVAAIACSRGCDHEYVAVRAQRAGAADAYLFGGEHRRWGLRIFESMPMMGYGGWVSTPPLPEDEERELTCAWLAACHWPLVELTCAPGRAASLPQHDALAGLLNRLGLQRLAPADTQTHLLDLAASDAALLARARPRMRSYLRQLDQQGFEFERGGRELVCVFHDRYRRASQQWQVAATHVYPVGFFDALCDDAAADIWLVAKQGQPLAAAAMLLGAKEVLYLASGVERVAGPNSAMDALIWHVARHYRDRGFATLNLGASEGLDSVRRFKEKFGAVAASYRRVTYCLPRIGATVVPFGAGEQ